jgi:tetratricopeptide (TPR) repeat protein
MTVAPVLRVLDERRRSVVLIAVALALVTFAVDRVTAQATPEGPSTRNGAWTMTSFPPTAFPASKVPEAEALSGEAVRAMSQGRSAEARGLWEKAIALDPAHPFAYWRLGSYSANDPARGSELIHRQVEKAPSPPAYLHGAFILQQLGRLDESLAMWREGVRRYPDDRNMAALFGEALLSAGRAEEAVTLLEGEAKRRPGSSRLRLHFGRALIAAGDAEAGLTELSEAARLEDSLQMWRAQANVRATARLDLDTALMFARRAVAAGEAENATIPDAAPPGVLPNATIRLVRAWDLLSLVHATRGDVVEARAYGVAAWRLSPNAASMARLGAMAEAAGDTTSAAVDYARASLFATPDAAAPAARMRALVPEASVPALRADARIWDQTVRVLTVSVDTAVPAQANLVIRADRAGRILSAAPAGGNATPIAPILARVRELTVPPLLPDGSSIDEIVLQWVVTCDGAGTCRLSPLSVPRNNPFETF